MTVRTRRVWMTTIVATALVGAAPVLSVAGPPVAAGLSTPTSTLPATVASPSADAADAPDVMEIGTSVEGRPITVARRGDPDGWRVLVIGVIHGDEAAGLDIVARLSERPVPAGVELYLMDSMNPDGTAADVRQNANGVDLNRNFPYNWGPIGEPGNWEYAGPSAASEPETRAVVESPSGSPTW